MLTILAIESSCDDTSAAIITDGIVRSNIVASQEVHRLYGGVVPELASRAHVAHIVPVVDTAITKAGLAKDDIDAVAFTQAPGLIGSLLVGASFAKSFAQARDLPVIAVHHMQAHVMAHFIDAPAPAFPFLCLTVSGGHTQIVLMKDFGQMEVLGETIDDAAGEAFDKTAKMLGLPYPGGPMVDKQAQQGDPKKFTFPISDMPGLDFSFSGIKTSVLYFLQKETKKNPAFIEEAKADICASVQDAIIRSLMKKLVLAAAQTGAKEVGIAGGVSANSGLRKAFVETGIGQGWQTYIPKFEYCTDNAAMIAMTAHYKFLAGDFADYSLVPTARATWA